MKETKKFDLFIYLSVAIVFALLLLCMLKTPFLSDFASTIEGKTFDLRQKILSSYKTPEKNDIKIIALDQKSYEFIVDTYGDWPVERRFWANLINELEKYEPNLLVLDFMFPKKSSKGGKDSDGALISAVNLNDNVIVGMFFDSESIQNRTPTEVPNRLKNTIKNDTVIKENNLLIFQNYQPILKEILSVSPNIGSVNFVRESDGIIRYMPVFVYYNGDYYKNISFLTALKYLNLNKNNFEMKGGKIALDNKIAIPIKDTGRAVMNWYKDDSFERLSLADVYEAIRNNDNEFLNKNIKNKVIYLGATTPLLNDIKPTPVSATTSGVEVHATFFANLVNNDLIFHVPLIVDILITMALILLTILSVRQTKNVFASLLFAITIIVVYFILNISLMYFCNLWLGIIMPLLGMVTFFIASYILKYLLKSKDYEQTYQLAVTDVMTQLFNHRYFQEQMSAQTQNYQRYKTSFSLIMTDIDFFKKFNDTYGHQSGDAVLKQVAQIMKSCVRATDVPCRYGGEEMAVILTNTNKEDAIITAHKICETVRNTKVTLATGDVTNVTISVGVATMPENGETPQKLIEACDKCLYKAKESGRNQVVSK